MSGYRKKAKGNDARKFTHAAMRTKKINVRPKISRGGIQL